MKDKKAISTLVLIFLILFFVLLCLMFFLLIALKNVETDKLANISATTPEDEKAKSIEEVIKKYNSEYLNRENNRIYLVFSNDLYDENGKSNEKFFNNLIDDLKIFFEGRSFYLIDDKNNINIQVRYDAEIEEYEIIINNIKEFFKQSNGKDYIKVETSQIVEPSNLYVSNGYLERLVNNQMYLSSIEQYLDEGEKLANEYTSYYNGQIQIKLAPNKSVLNILFSDDYKQSILVDVDMSTPLSKIYELHSDNTFGSLDKKYLGYRSNNLYYFFYNDEISVYGYSYRLNSTFEELLSTYLEDKNLDDFVKGLSNRILAYDTFEYDSDIKKAHIVFPTRGIEIDIEDNNPKGITLYSNYYFTDKTREFVKNGLISFESDKDLVEEYEIQRRESKR